MSEQWYCPDCGPITKMREEFLSGGYMCAECEAPASPIPAFVTVLQQQIAERDAELSLYRNGYKGACYACESVGELNVSLNIINKGLDEANIIFADRIATLEAASKPIDVRALVKAVADLDFANGDSLCLKLGGDGDNGEILIEWLSDSLRAAGYPVGEEG